MNDNKNQNNLKRRKAPPKGHGKFKRGDKAKDFKGSISKLFQYLGKHKLSLVSVIVFAVGSTVFNIFGPKILGNATTEIYTGIVGKISGGGGIDFAAVGRILLLCVTLYVLSAVLSWLQGFIMAGVTQKVTYRMRREISEKIHRLPMNYFDKVPYGEVLSRVTNDVDTLSQGLNQSATQVITSVTMLIGILVMMLSISPMMTLIAVVSVPLSLLIVGLIVGKSQKHFTNQQNYLGEVDGQIEEIFAGQNIVKAFNAEQKVTEEFNSANDKLYESAWKSQGLSGMMHPLMSFVGNLGYVAVAIFGGYLVIKGRINVGDIQSFIQYVRQFTQPLSQIAQISNMMQSTAASAERVFEFLAEKEEELTAQNPMNIEDVEGSVQFAHVHFGYASGCHTSEDVFLAVYNPNGQVPMGWIDGTDLAGYMYGLLGVKGSLDELTSQIFVKSDVLLAGHETAVEGDKKAPVLVIDGKVRVPANRSYIEVDGQKKELASVSVYVPKNKNFYISREILNYL